MAQRLDTTADISGTTVASLVNLPFSDEFSMGDVLFGSYEFRGGVHQDDDKESYLLTLTTVQFFHNAVLLLGNPNTRITSEYLHEVKNKWEREFSYNISAMIAVYDGTDPESYITDVYTGYNFFLAYAALLHQTDRPRMTHSAATWLKENLFWATLCDDFELLTPFGILLWIENIISRQMTQETTAGLCHGYVECLIDCLIYQIAISISKNEFGTPSQRLSIIAKVLSVKCRCIVARLYLQKCEVYGKDLSNVYSSFEDECRIMSVSAHTIKSFFRVFMEKIRLITNFSLSDAYEFQKKTRMPLSSTTWLDIVDENRSAVTSSWWTNYMTEPPKLSSEEMKKKMDAVSEWCDFDYLVSLLYEEGHQMNNGQWWLEQENYLRAIYILYLGKRILQGNEYCLFSRLFDDGICTAETINETLEKESSHPVILLLELLHPVVLSTRTGKIYDCGMLETSSQRCLLAFVTWLSLIVDETRGVITYYDEKGTECIGNVTSIFTKLQKTF